MAQQNFKRYAYGSDSSGVFAIRASTKVAGVQTTTPALAAPGVPTVRTGRGSRGYGVRPRYLRLSRTAGTAPNEKVYYDKLPIFLVADVATMRALTTVTLDGVTWNVVGYVPESIR